jgi:MFS family permease
MAGFANAIGMARLPALTWWLAFGAFFKFAARFVTPFVGFYLTQKFGSSVREVGYVLAIYGLGTLIGFPVFGFIIDHSGSRIVIVWTSFTDAIVLLAMPFVSTVWEFTVLSFIYGLCFAGFRPAHQDAMTQSCTDADRPRAYALYSMAWNLGSAFSVVAGGALFATLPTGIFVTASVFSIVTAIFFAAFPYERLSNRDAAPAERPAAEGADAAPWRDWVFLELCLCLAIVECIRSQSVSTFPIYLRDIYHLTPPEYGVVMGIGFVVLVVFSLPVSAAVVRWDRRKVAAVGAVMMCGAYGLAPWFSGFPVATAIVVISSAGQVVLFPMLAAMVMARAPARHRGKYLGLYYAGSSLAWAGAPAAGSWIYATWGTETLWSACALLGLVVAALQLRPRRA